MVKWIGDGGISGYNARTSMPTDVDDNTVAYLLASNTMVDVEGVTRLQYALNEDKFNAQYVKYTGDIVVDDRISARANITFESASDIAAGEGAGRRYSAAMVVANADQFLPGVTPSRQQMLDVLDPNLMYYRATDSYANVGARSFIIRGPHADDLEPNTKYWVMVFPTTIPSAGAAVNRANDVPLGGAQKARGISMWTNRSPLAPVITSPLDGATTPSGGVLNFSFTSNDADAISGKLNMLHLDMAGVQVQYAPQPTAAVPDPVWQDLPISGDEAAGNEGVLGPGWYIQGVPNAVITNRGASMLLIRQTMPLDCERASITPLAGQLGQGAWQLRMRTFDFGHPYGFYMNAFARNAANIATTTPDNAPESNTSPWSPVVNITISERVPAPIPLSPINDVALAEGEPVTLSWLYRNTYLPPFPQARRHVQIRQFPETAWTTLVDEESAASTLVIPELAYPLTATSKYEWRVQVTDSGALGTTEPGVVNTESLVPWRGANWRYKSHTDDNVADYSATAFDDSGWKIGLAPFGDEGYPDQHEALGWKRVRTTVVNADRAIWLRRSIASPGAGLDIHVKVRVDGGVKVWWNGALVADPGEDWTLSNDRTVVIPAASVLSNNVLAVRALDDAEDPRGDDMVIDVAVDAVGVGADPTPIVTPGVDGVTSPWSPTASFWVVPAPVSGPVRDPSSTIDGATLGCGTHRVFVYRRGGKERVGELTGLSHIDWSRVRDDISAAKVVVSDWGVDCGDLLKKLQCWAYELVIFRDNGFGTERVWEGPITLLTYEVDSVTIHAKDVMAYAYRRIIKQAMNDSGNSSTAGDTVTARATKVLQYVFAPDDPNVLPYLHPILSVDDAQQYRSLPPYSRTAFEEVDDMAANAGLDYTCSGRSILLWSTKHRIGTLPEFRDADLGAPPIVSEYGMSMANHYVVSDGNGVHGAAVRGGLVLDASGLVSGNDETYGLVEMLSSTWASESEEEAGTYTEEGLETVRESFREYAERSIADRYPPPVVVRVPDNTTLNPGTVLSIQQLIPGVVVPLRSTGTLRSVVATQKLDKVQVTEVAGRETISVTLSPFSRDDVEIVEGGG